MIDNREVQTFGSAVSSILHKAVNEFLIVRIVIVPENLGTPESEYSDNRTFYQFNREISEIMRSNYGMFVIQVVDIEHHIKKRYSKGYINFMVGFCKGICLLLIENMKAFEMFKLLTLGCPKEKDLRIMFVRGATAGEVLQASQAFDKESPAGPGMIADAVNEYTIVDTENGFYELLEINRFVGGGACDETSMATINRFSKANLEWEKPLQRLEDKMTFNGCKVTNGLMQTQATASNRSFDGGQVEEFSGLIVDNMKLIAEIGNFTPSYFYTYPSTGKEKSDGEEAYYNDKAFTFFYNFFVIDFFKPLRLVQFIEKEFYFVVPQGELYTEWEKLFFAFDVATWLLIVLTFAAAFAVIIIINNFAKQFVMNFVFGRRVKTPSLNVLRIFFGMDQTILPGRNFARFLLTLFLIWTLIIRTCYQALLFENLVGDGRKPPIKTIDELLQRNFTYHTHQSHCFHLVDTIVTGKGK